MSTDYFRVKQNPYPSGPSDPEAGEPQDIYVPAMMIGLANIFDQDKRAAYAKVFFFLHLVGAVVLMSTAISIFAYGISQNHPTHHYWTISALKETPTPIPPGDYAYFTSFEVIHEASFWWVFMVAFPAGLYHTLLALPNFLTMCWSYEENKEFVALNEKQIVPWIWQPSALFYMWFHQHVNYGSASFKYLFYGTSYAFFTTMVAVLVGVPDFLHLCYIWILPFLGYWSLWNIHYTKARTLYTAHKDSEPEEIILSLNPAEVSAAAKKTMDAYLEKIKHIQFSQSQLLLSLVAIIVPFASIVTYFAKMISANADHIPWYVWYAALYYIVGTIVHAFMLWGWHHGFVITQDHYGMELLLTIGLGIAFSSIPLGAFFGSRDDGFLYGLSPSP